MNEKQKKEIEEILGDLTCSKDFRCYKSGFEYLCKAQNVGIKSFLRCMEEDGKEYKFSVTLGSAHFSECPRRKYIVKKLPQFVAPLVDKSAPASQDDCTIIRFASIGKFDFSLKYYPPLSKAKMPSRCSAFR